MEERNFCGDAQLSIENAIDILKNLENSLLTFDP